MNYIEFALKFSFVIFIFIAITKVFMEVENYVGEKLGIAEIFMHLFQRKKRL